MDISNLISDAFKYPISDIQKFLILGVILVILSLNTILPSLGVDDASIMLIVSLISFLCSFIFLGYIVDVVKKTIDGENILPDFDFAKQFVTGIKYFVLEIVYFIIPAIIILIVATVTGLFNSTFQIFTSIINQTAENATLLNTTNVMSLIPQNALNTFSTAFIITFIVSIILVIIFSIISVVGLSRLAKYNSLTEALRFGEIFNDISRIGILKIIITLIILFIISFILFFVMGLISAIPYVGVIIATLIIGSFVTLFNNRAIGLLYLDE